MTRIVALLTRRLPNTCTRPSTVVLKCKNTGGRASSLEPMHEATVPMVRLQQHAQRNGTAIAQLTSDVYAPAHSGCGTRCRVSAHREPIV